MTAPDKFAFTTRYPGISRHLVTEIYVTIPRMLLRQMKHVKTFAIWDTGATNSVIDINLAKQMNLPPTGMAKVIGVNSIDFVNKYTVDIILPNNLNITGVEVTEGRLDNKVQFLIGMDIITLGDFVVTNKGKTVFTFQIPSTRNIDFVSELNNQLKTGKSAKKKRRKKA